MNDIESEITGKTIEEALLDANIPKTINELPVSKLEDDNDNYEELKRLEVRTNWLRHEGTGQFINKLEEVRQDKLVKAENAAKNGNAEEALRLILQSCSIRETIQIIGE